ncbi:MAG: hypothetical protein HY356_07630 [Gammaproteobacteria bacterium]|nr:hypothetical protein [Gammaproteobacteria bacterium]
MPDSETVIAEFLGEYGLSAERYSKSVRRSGRTPDYKVLRDGQLKFYCEVKNSEKDQWLDDLLDLAEPGEIVGGLRNDPVFNRLTKHIHKARGQFDAVNPREELPNVLAFHNEDKHAGFLDLLAVTTGNFFADDGSVHPIYKNFSEGRVKTDIERIHLFIWLDEYNPFRFLFNTINSRYQEDLCSLFEYDSSDLKLVRT